MNMFFKHEPLKLIIIKNKNSNIVFQIIGNIIAKLLFLELIF